jgi:hypothetical protein
VQCKNADCISIVAYYLKLQIFSAAFRHGVADDVHQGRLLISQIKTGNQTA